MRKKLFFGFTLIETLLYTVIVGLLLGTIVMLTNTMLVIYNRSQATLIVEQNLRIASEKIEERVHEADQIIEPSTGATSTLQLKMSNSAIDPTVISFSSQTGQLNIQEGSSASVSLLSNETQVTGASFQRITGGLGGIQYVISARLRNASSSYQSVTTVTSTVSVYR